MYRSAAVLNADMLAMPTAVMSITGIVVSLNTIDPLTSAAVSRCSLRLSSDSYATSTQVWAS
jgi:hypothetical protein